MGLSTFEDKISIILADDHEVVRAGLRRLLSIDKSFHITEEAANGADAVELVRYYKPDIALLDILMPKKSGIEAAKEIKAADPKTLVVILTAFEDSKHLEQSLSAGANGYLTKDISAGDLVKSLHNVLRGERVFSKSILNLLQRKYSSQESDAREQVSITKREQQVLNRIAEGETSQEIADSLSISVRTVESHRYNIMQKLGIKNAAGLIRYAVLNYDYEGSTPD
ncbi:MAG: response regulator [Candidatus Kapaibacterium sp.]